MGFLGQTSTTKAMPVTVLMAGFQARCTLQVMGIVQTFLNDDQRSVFLLKDVTLHGLEAGNPAVSMELEDLYVSKEQCQVIAFESLLDQDQTGLMPHEERVAVYTSHYVIQGNFHMGVDAGVGDLVDAFRTLYIAATDVEFFPLFQPQTAVIQTAPLVYVYREGVRMFHAV
jgi:hypothetical protein